MSTPFENAVAEVVATQTSAGFLFRFCLGHAVFYTVKVTDTFAGFTLGHVYSSARRAVIKTRFRNLNVTADNVVISQVFVYISSYYFCSSNSFDYGCRTGSTVSTGKYTRNVIESAVFFG